MPEIIKLLRPKDWAKNLFLFIPSFFAGKIFNLEGIEHLLGGFAAFSFLASSIYIVNDLRDIEDDKKHPKKSKRPLASGKVKKSTGLIVAVLLLLAGVIIGYLVEPTGKFLFLLGLYYLLNLGYSFGLKNISIVDIMIVAAGFVLRVKGGAVIGKIDTTEWLIIMTFLLALFMAIGKRRDDVILKLSTGNDMRRAIKGYTLDYLNVVLGLVCAIIIVAYINYTVTGGLYKEFGHRLYYTSLFVIAGVLRYLQIIFVLNNSGSPTEILYKDRFIQIVLMLWVVSFFSILYLKNVSIFD